MCVAGLLSNGLTIRSIPTQVGLSVLGNSVLASQRTYEQSTFMDASLYAACQIELIVAKLCCRAKFDYTPHMTLHM